MTTCGHCGGWQLAQRRRGPVQPRSTFGSPESIIERGADIMAVQTERLGEAIARGVHGLSNAKAINRAIKASARAWKPARIARPLEVELLHGQWLGALDADYEMRSGRPVAVPSFADLHAPRLLAPYDRSTDPAFAKRPVKDAREQFERRGAVTRPVYDAMSDAARRRSVTVAGAATADIVRTVQRELVHQVSEGAELRDFSRRVVPRLEAAGWTPQNPSHVENVLRTNVSSAYNAGRARQMTQPAVLRFRPFWQIVTVNDGPPRQRPTHQAAHGVVLRADDPFWLTAYPPFGYQCRCRVRTLSAREGADRVVDGGSIRGLPDPGFTSGLSQLDVPPPELPPNLPPANETVPPPANDTIPPEPTPARRPSTRPPPPDPRHVPIDTREAFEAHMISRGAPPQYLQPGAHAKMREVLGRDVTPDELDSFIGHEAFADLPGERDVTVEASYDKVKFITRIGRDTAELVRTFRRDEGKLAVHHDLLVLDKKLQGGGVGPAVIKKQLEVYERLGVDQIDLDAAWVGRYYWPKLGFDVTPSVLKFYRDTFREYLEKRGAPAAAVRRLTEGIKSMRDIATTRVGTKELGKDFFLGDVLEPIEIDEETGQPKRGRAHAGGLLEGLVMKVRPGDPVYENMKAEVSKPPKKRTRADTRALLLAAGKRRRRREVPVPPHEPPGRSLADDLIGDDAEPADGWRRPDVEDWTEGKGAKQSD